MTDEQALTSYFKNQVEILKISGKGLSRRQYYFGRMLTILTLRNRGLTYKKIGECYGITGQSVRVVFLRSQRWINAQRKFNEQAKDLK